MGLFGKIDGGGVGEGRGKKQVLHVVIVVGVVDEDVVWLPVRPILIGGILAVHLEAGAEIRQQSCGGKVVQVPGGDL